MSQVVWESSSSMEKMVLQKERWEIQESPRMYNMVKIKRQFQEIQVFSLRIHEDFKKKILTEKEFFLTFIPLHY